METAGVRHRVISLAIALIMPALALPAVAHAADPAAATITDCQADHLTLAGKVARNGAAARKARGATLQMRFQALALFGLPQVGAWRDIGRKTSAAAQQDFAALPADNWIGYVNWRFKKGSRTVLSGNARSQPVRIGARKGKANCTLWKGSKPIDKTPPQIFIAPADDNWHHGPTTVQLVAQDDLSGVKGLRYSLDGGPITAIANGGTFTIAGEGVHTLNVAATDVAGNTSTRSATVKVDASAAQPTVTDVAPKSGTVLAGSLKNGPFTITLDRSADPSTVSTSTVKLTNVDSGSSPAYSVGCAGTPCTKISVNPSGPLGEGRYSLVVNGVRTGEGENLPFQAFSAAYSVPFYENASGVDPGASSACLPTAASLTTQPATVNTPAPENGTLDFDWSYAGGTGWSVQAMDGANPLGSALDGGPGTGHSTLNFQIPAGNHSISFTFTSKCSTKLDTSNLVAARVP
jgi:hypothetical protein